MTALSPRRTFSGTALKTIACILTVKYFLFFCCTVFVDLLSLCIDILCILLYETENSGQRYPPDIYFL